MPEVPHNMQQDLQRMELEARSADPTRTASSGPGGAYRYGREPSLTNVLKTHSAGYGAQYQNNATADYSPASNYSPWHENDHAQRAASRYDMQDKPSFSPFPHVSGDHVPPSDDEKEGVLASSKEHVLHSNDPNMQICWARDVLSYVEIAAEAATREYELCRKPGDRDMGRPTTPRVEHELRVDATNIVNYLADQGHPEAVFIRSKWMEFGKFGQRQDKKEAYSGYTTAAQQGWGRAEYRIGMLYENSNDVEKAMRHYNAGLALNDSAACYRLGMINLMGQHGQRKDIPKGLDLIHSAADSADEDAPQGAFVYGMIIARDLPDVNVPDGVLSYDVTVARQYIEKAAYLGFAKAQLKMGQAYELCQLGCDFNPALSLHYYGLAAKQGQPEACLGVSRWFLFGYESAFTKNEQLAFRYAQIAANSKLPTGEFAMGYYYEIGIHVEKDLREARIWYELAAEHGNKDALGRLDGLSQAKTLSKADHETTTLTRLKSTHGSQRGKRPDRFKQVKAMPALSEGEQQSPRVSPQPSPRGAEFGGANMPDPSRPGAGRPPAFQVNIPERPKSSAPYPEDDHKPEPLNLPRSRSTAPYPEDEYGQKPPHSPHYNPNIRPSGPGGPPAGPGGAFGIRTQSPGQGQGRGAGPNMRGQGPNLGIPPAGMDPNGRGRTISASAGYQGQPGGYDYNRPVSQQYDGRYGGGPGGSPGGPAPNNPGANRLTKANPNPYPGQQYPSGGGGGGGGYGAPNQPGNGGYGPRNSSRPSSRSSGAPTMSGGMGSGARVDSYGGAKPGLPVGGPGGGRASARPVELKDQAMHGGAGRSSAPPAQNRPSTASPAPSATTVSSAQTAPAKTGPSTFEEMGIPQAKKDDDCVSPHPTCSRTRCRMLTRDRLSCKIQNPLDGLNAEKSMVDLRQCIPGQGRHGAFFLLFNDTTNKYCHFRPRLPITQIRWSVL
jgi:TPR repeat protein